MRKYLAPILTIAIVASLAGVLYIRANVDGSLPKAAPATEESHTIDVGPTVVWSVTRSGAAADTYSYSLATEQTSGPESNVETAGVVRFNQSSDLCDKGAVASLEIECNFNSVANVLVMTAYGMMGDEKWMQAYTVRLSDLGISPSAMEGYLVPVAVSDDKSAIYLGRRVESESWVAGLWKLDVATGKVSEISYVREHNLYQYDINPATKQLIGVTFVPPESLGEDMSGPSSLHSVNLVTGNGEVPEQSLALFENPMLSDDGSRYEFRESGDGAGPGRTVVLPVATGRVADGWEIDGVAKDWFGDTMVFDRDGNLFLYDLKTKTETQLTHETDATVEYLGVVK